VLLDDKDKRLGIVHDDFGSESNRKDSRIALSTF